MAHLKASPIPIVSITKLCRKSPFTSESTTVHAKSRLRSSYNNIEKCRTVRYERWVSGPIIGGVGRRWGFLCSSTTGREVGLVEEGDGGKYGFGEGQFGELVSEFGWRVRRVVEEEGEMRRVAQVQAEAFHVTMPLFDQLFYEFFEAEVLDALVYKIRHSAPNRYACLVAEPTDASDQIPTSQKGLVGVVDVTVMNDEPVLRHLQGAGEYLYVSGIAVLTGFRRKKVATVLLKACDLLSILWGYEYLALRAYEDDSAARTLYSNTGYRIVSGDPPWMSTWIGRKRRVLMIKRSALRDWC